MKIAQDILEKPDVCRKSSWIAQFSLSHSGKWLATLSSTRPTRLEVQSDAIVLLRMVPGLCSQCAVEAQLRCSQGPDYSATLRCSTMEDRFKEAGESIACGERVANAQAKTTD